MSGRDNTGRKDADRDNNAPFDQRLMQCIILMIREQNHQKDVLEKFVTDMGQFREKVYDELEKLHESVDSVNRKVSSGRKCICGGDMGGAAPQAGGTKHKIKSRRPARRSPENSDDDTDPNVNKRREKRTDKRGLDSFYDRSYPPESPVQIKSDPPGNIPRPVPTSKPSVNGKAPDYSMTKVPLPNKALIKAQPQETDFIDIMKTLKLEVNPATIAAISSAAHMRENSLASRPPALHTVLIVDTSESMRGNAFDTAKTFVQKVIDGIDMSAEEFGLEEYLSVITCGESTGIIQPFTNDFLQIRNTVDRLKVGGRTPLMTSLTLALCYLELQSECVKVAEHVIMPRVVVVSDFDATIDTHFKGRDADNSEERIKVQRELFNLGITFKLRGYGVVCVPVGESNGPVAEAFVAKCNGDLVTPRAVQDVGNYYRYQMAIGRALLDFDEGVKQNQEPDVYDLVQRAMPQAGLGRKHETGVLALLEKILQKEDDIGSSEDEEFVAKGVTYKGKSTKNFIKDYDDPPDLPEWIPTRNVDNIGLEEESGLPSIGSRVKRAEDWKWENQDNNAPGTVVGHKQKGIAYILWDNGQLGAYRHGHKGQYDIRQAQEPRHVRPGDIEVGCCVIRGTDWERGDEDGGHGTVGVVVRKMRDRYVQVRWPSRVIETYRFGADNKWDLEVTLDMPHTGGTETPSGESQTSHRNTPDPVSGNSAAASGDLKPWWSWKDKHDQWRPFSEASVAKIENKHSSGLLQHCLVDYEGKPVKLYLSENQCIIGGEKYPVKREMLKAEEIESMKMLEKFLQPID